MDIQDLPRRHHTHAAHGGKASQPAAATSDVPSSASQEATASTSPGTDGATTQQVSGGGRFLHFLQAFEDKHPEEAKRILSGIADKLRADAKQAGPWSARLEGWADKVQKAADTGDMSNLKPTWQPHAHFGMRAYQEAQAAPESATLERVASSLPAAASTDAAAAVSSSAAQQPTGSTDAATSSSASEPAVTTPIIAGTPAAMDSSRTSA